MTALLSRYQALCAKSHSATELQQLDNHQPPQSSAAMPFSLSTSKHLSVPTWSREFWADSSFCRNQGVGSYLTVTLASWMPQFRCYEAKIRGKWKSPKWPGVEPRTPVVKAGFFTLLYFRLITSKFIYFQAWGKMLWASIMIISFWESMS